MQGGVVRCRRGALINDVSVPFEAVGFQRIKYEFGCTCLLAWRIDIFNTKKPEPVVDPGLQVAGNGGDQRAEVQRAGWRGREPADVLVTGSDRPGRGIAVRRAPGVPGLPGTM